MPSFNTGGSNENGWYENGIYKAVVKVNYFLQSYMNKINLPTNTS